MVGNPDSGPVGNTEGGGVSDGWWQATDGCWYPAEANPGAPWRGEVRGPDGELPPGPGWWLAADRRWYPPEMCPGQRYPEVVAVSVPVAAVLAAGERTAEPVRAVRADQYLGARLEDERRRATTVITAAAVAIVAGATTMSSAGDAGTGALLGRLGLLPLLAGGVFAAIGGVQYLRSQLDR